MYYFSTLKSVYRLYISHHDGGRSFHVDATANYESMSIKTIVISPHASVFNKNFGYFDFSQPIRCFLL